MTRSLALGALIEEGWFMIAVLFGGDWRYYFGVSTRVRLRWRFDIPNVLPWLIAQRR